ncbi:MAG TPA: ABC transporter permease, partial [Capillimicrobium sp.]
MFYVSYIASELRRRAGRTLLTTLGLGVGVGLVVAVSALSDGLARAQDEVLAPLTGVGTGLSVARPLDLGGDGDGAAAGPFGDLSPRERRQLQRENGGGMRIDLREAGEPGERFRRTSFMTAQLSVPARAVERIAGLDGVRAAAGSLTLNAVTVSGKVPEEGVGAPPGGDTVGAPGPGGPRNLDFETRSVTGVDASRPELAAVSPDEIVDGSYLRGDRREALVGVAYAQANDIDVGDEVELMGDAYAVVGVAQAPLGGQASDLYVPLRRLQRASGRVGRVNTILVRADTAGSVAGVERAIERSLEGASVTTSSDLAARVGGSLTDAKDLSDRLGAALTVVALAAAFLIASLLTLSSVTKRVRELGTLKAIGWPQRRVVRQVAGESLAQGALGGVLGALVGAGAAAAIGAAGITLDATVAAGEAAGAPALMGPPGGGFGQGAVQAGSQSV